MPKSHPPYSLEFRRRMVELVRSGRSPEALSKEFEPTAQSIHKWVAQADRDEGRRNAAWFARETGSIPERYSDS